MIETIDLDKYTYEVKVPDVLMKVIRTARSDLYSGPCYLDKYGNPVSMFDKEYDHAFDFPRACKIIGDWCDSNLPSQLYVEPWCGIPETSPPEESDEYYEFDYRSILKGFLGKELASYV